MALKKKSNGALKKLKRVQWSAPSVILTLITIGMGIYTGGHFMKMGIFLGCAMALSAIVLLAKAPGFIQNWVYGHPFGADVILSGLATMMVAGFVGTGLTLGIGAVTCGLFLSWAIPATVRFRTASTTA